MKPCLDPVLHALAWRVHKRRAEACRGPCQAVPDPRVRGWWAALPPRIRSRAGQLGQAVLRGLVAGGVDGRDRNRRGQIRCEPKVEPAWAARLRQELLTDLGQIPGAGPRGQLGLDQNFDGVDGVEEYADEAARRSTRDGVKLWAPQPPEGPPSAVSSLGGLSGGTRPPAAQDRGPGAPALVECEGRFPRRPTSGVPLILASSVSYFVSSAVKQDYRSALSDYGGRGLATCPPASSTAARHGCHLALGPSNSKEKRMPGLSHPLDISRLPEISERNLVAMDFPPYLKRGRSRHCSLGLSPFRAWQGNWTGPHPRDFVARLQVYSRPRLHLVPVVPC